MGEEETYIRAKLTEINTSIDRLTDLLNRMIEIMTKITDLEDSTSELALAVTANGEKIDDLTQMVKKLGKQASVPASSSVIAEKGVVTGLSSVIDNLDSQVREGIIASDLATKVDDAAETLEQKGASSSLVVKMQRWVRILKTYGPVDTVSPADLAKLREDLKDWQKEIGQMR